MGKIFRKKLAKKGFTLAELLIVVAIIAVLVAIAAPLFLGALDEAKTQVAYANLRSVRAAGVAEILTNYTAKSYGDAKYTSGWYVTANVDASGNITNLQVADSGTETKAEDLAKTEYPTDITVLITELKAS